MCKRENLVILLTYTKLLRFDSKNHVLVEHLNKNAMNVLAVVIQTIVAISIIMY